METAAHKCSNFLFLVFECCTNSCDLVCTHRAGALIKNQPGGLRGPSGWSWSSAKNLSINHQPLQTPLQHLELPGLLFSPSLHSFSFPPTGSLAG